MSNQHSIRTRLPYICLAFVAVLAGAIGPRVLHGAGSNPQIYLPLVTSTNDNLAIVFVSRQIPAHGSIYSMVVST